MPRVNFLKAFREGKIRVGDVVKSSEKSTILYKVTSYDNDMFRLAWGREAEVLKASWLPYKSEDLMDWSVWINERTVSFEELLEAELNDLNAS